MSLRFIQSIQLDGPHPDSSRARNMDRTQAQNRSEEFEIERPFGEAKAGSGIILGRPYEVAEAVIIPKDLGSRSRPFRTPDWLDGRFRPRNLTQEGLTFLKRMDPAVSSELGGVEILGINPWSSLEERLEYLQRKYLALDMVRKGFAVETDGKFWPKVLQREADRAGMMAIQRRRELSLQAPISVEEAFVWMGAFREASWDQMRSLHPHLQDHMDALLQAMLDQKLIESRRVIFGEGTLETLRISENGMRIFRMIPEGKELLNRGFGPRKTGRGIGEYHEQAVGDGIGYFCHEIQVNDGTVTGIALDSMLRREYLGNPHSPDFRIEFETDLGKDQWDIEVMGVGCDYRGNKISKVKSSVSTRIFDPVGRKAASRMKDVGVMR